MIFEAKSLAKKKGSVITEPFAFYDWKLRFMGIFQNIGIN